MNINKQDFVGQSSSTLNEAIEQAIAHGQHETHQFKVIEIIGRHQMDATKSYEVVLSERQD